MKKIFSKILSVLGIASVIAGLVLPVISVKAAFNDDPLDVKTLKIANSTRDAGNYNWATTVAADAGNDIALLVYYHNTAATTATKTRVRINFPSASQTTQAISVNIWADNVPSINDSATLNISSAQTVTFLSGSTRWYPNQNSDASQALPFGQSGDEIISANGLNIGDMASGWGTQGYITLKARISNNTAPITNPNPGPVAAAPAVATYAASSIIANSAILNSIINPNSVSTTAWFEYGTNYNSLIYSVGSQNLGSGPTALSMPVTLSNLSANTTYYFRAVAQNPQGAVSGDILSFTTLKASQTVFAPSAITNSATNISVNSATFNAQVNPNNGATTAWFEYGTSSGSLIYIAGVQSMGSGSAYSNTSVPVSDLSANTTYYFRAVAQNPQGASYGNILSFTTASAQTNVNAPSITTNAATVITKNSANLNGTINPNGSSADVWFEYGISPANLDKTTSTQNINGSSYVPVTIGVSNLSENTVYYFRPVARNSSGATYGAINNFTTNAVVAVNLSGPVAGNNSKIAVTASARSAAFVEASQIIENMTSPNGSQASIFSDVGDRLKYTVTLKNIGRESAHNLKVNSQIPSIFKYIESAPSAAYNLTGDIISWNVSRLKPGEIVSLHYIVEVKGGLNTTVDNQAKVYLPFAGLNIFTNSVSTFISKQKPVALNFIIDKNEVKPGDSLNYSLTVKNTNNYSIKNILLSIGLPQNVELVDFDFNLASKNDNSLIVDLGSINAGEQITKKFIVKVGKASKANDILTTIAIVNYQDQVGNSQPVVSASVSTSVIRSANLAASIFGGIASFSIIDWLTLVGLLAFIFVIISVGSGLMKKYRAGQNQ